MVHFPLVGLSSGQLGAPTNHFLKDLADFLLVSIDSIVRRPDFLGMVSDMITNHQDAPIAHMNQSSVLRVGSFTCVGDPVQHACRTKLKLIDES